MVYSVTLQLTEPNTNTPAKGCRICVFNQKNKQKLTTNSDVAVLPGCVWVGGEAPWPLASVWVPAVVIVQAAVGVPALMQTP